MTTTSPITDRISREVFLAVYNSYLPNAWTKFAFRYFSKDTIKKDLYVKNTLQEILLALFVLGFIGTIFSFSYLYIGILTCLFVLILLSLGILMTGAHIMNNIKLKKQMKLLKINIDEYNALVSAYL